MARFLREKGQRKAGDADVAPQLPTVLTLSLVYTSGLVFPPERWTDEAGLGTLSLVIWVRAIKYLDRTGGRMVVVERDPRQDLEDIRELALSTAEVDELLRLLRATGLPDKQQELEPVLDSSDRWAHMTLNVAMRTSRRSVDVDMHTSSYEGPDAPILRECLSTLLRLADAKDPGVWYDLTGVWKRRSE